MPEALLPPPARMVDGQRVISDEPTPSPLPPHAGCKPVVFRYLRQLTLENGEVVYGCGSCDMTGSRGDVQKHRTQEHGVPKRTGRRPQPEPLPVSDDLALLTLGEVVELAREAGSFGDMVAQLELKAEDWRQRALAAESWQRKVTLRLAQVGFVLNVEEDA